jgi:membrane protease YdiL (CAAX protease family)
MGTDTYQYGAFDDRLRSITHSIGLIVAAFGTGIVLASAVFLLLSAVGFSVESTADIPAPLRALAGALQYVGFFVAGLLYLRWRDDSPSLFRIGVPSLRDLGWAVLGLVGLLAALIGASALLTQLGIDSAANNAITQGQEQPTYLLYLIPLALLFNAPAEEFIFRGLVQGLFRKAYGVVPAIVIASLLFGVAHYLALGGQGSKLAYLGIAAVLGLILGVLYELTENLVVPMLVHGAFNAIQFYLAYLSATGQVPS